MCSQWSSSALISSSLQERRSHLPTQLCELAMRTGVQVGRNHLTSPDPSPDDFLSPFHSKYTFNCSPPTPVPPVGSGPERRFEDYIHLPGHYLILALTPFPDASELPRKKAPKSTAQHPLFPISSHSDFCVQLWEHPTHMRINPPCPGGGVCAWFL